MIVMTDGWTEPPLAVAQSNNHNKN